MGEEFSAGPPKMPIGAVDNPYFDAFANPKDARKNKTHHLFGIIRQIRPSSPTGDFIGELNFAPK